MLVPVAQWVKPPLIG